MPYINDDIPYMYEDNPYMYEDNPYMHDDMPDMYEWYARYVRWYDRYARWYDRYVWISHTCMIPRCMGCYVCNLVSWDSCSRFCMMVWSLMVVAVMLLCWKTHGFHHQSVYRCEQETGFPSKLYVRDWSNNVYILLFYKMELSRKIKCEMKFSE